MDTMQVVWLVAFVGFLLLEGFTMGLYSIWFAAGALGGLIASFIAPDLFLVQIFVFLLLSAATLAGLRPFAQRWLSARKVNTNADLNIGKIGKVTERVNNRDASGAVYVYGKTWTARSNEDGEEIPVGALVKVLSIEGVKLIVTPAEEKSASV